MRESAFANKVCIVAGMAGYQIAQFRRIRREEAEA